ncbi:hypothetical protein [Desulfosporosinus sp. OT]|uniref:hypothetical protein n=1 Tax=Desulfosporosinus sp. OT TaxID=913865 RepID=UPI0005914E48|nr:hypothetical protein [Desulfosporosinus sp. OT]
MYDTALGPTTQSKLTVQAPGFREQGSSFGDSIILKNPPTAIISTGDYRAKSAILGALAAAHVLVRCPVFGVGRLNGSLLICLRRDVALVSYCVLVFGSWRAGETAHFMCTV